MFSIGLGEVLIILLIIIIFFSPSDLPKFIKIIKEIKSYFSEISKEIGQITEEIENNKIDMIKGDDGKFYPSYKEINLDKPKITDIDPDYEKTKPTNES